MKIAQLVVNTLPNTSYRYTTELNKQLLKLGYEADIISINDINFNEDFCVKLNTYEYCFIHSLPKSNDIYLKLINRIKIKKFLFITDMNIKQWHNSISLSNIQNLLRASSNIVINELATDIINEIEHLISKTACEEKLVNLKYIYDYSNLSFNNVDNKKKEISLISNKGIIANYELFLNLFQRNSNLDLIWHIYGVTKNIQTMSVNNLYVNKETNQKSLITNFSSTIEKTKVNVHGMIDECTCNDIISSNLFIANFDVTSILSYTLLDIIGNGTIPILHKDIAQRIKINKSQSLYDLKCGIYIDSTSSNDETLIQINKLLSSKNTYLQFINKNIKIFNQLFNIESIINDLLINLKIK